MNQTDRISLSITPCPKPRMTRSDKWKQRPRVMRYREFCDQVRASLDGFDFPEHGWHITFHVPMPKSWSKKKQADMDGQPHQSKPDLDNMVKAFLDALHKDDSGVWDGRATKRWGTSGRIELTRIDT